MIANLSGKLIEKGEHELIIDVNGVGYLVTVGQRFNHEHQLKENDPVRLIIHTVVKEDGISLYGFKNPISRKVFGLLLGVNGVGPRMALNIVDQIGPQNVVKAIVHDNINTLMQVSGIGKKTAQRIVLDLQEKIKLLPEAWGRDNDEGDNKELEKRETNEMLADAISALENLGFKSRRIERTVRKNMNRQQTLDDLLKKCLNELQK